MIPSGGCESCKRSGLENNSEATYNLHKWVPLTSSITIEDNLHFLSAVSHKTTWMIVPRVDADDEMCFQFSREWLFIVNRRQLQKLAWVHCSGRVSFFIIAIIRLRSHCKFFRFQRVRFFIFKLQEFSSGRRFMPSLAKQLLLADNYSAWWHWR